MARADAHRVLGCTLNRKADTTRELARRIKDATIIWKKLDLFWGPAEVTTARKLIVFDAVVRSKLIYGLESAQLTDEGMEDLDVFQRKALRRILGLATTWGQTVEWGSGGANQHE